MFGFGNPSELQTPMGIAVKEATNNLRLNPDWSKNMDICDAVNRQKDSADQVAKALRRRLDDSNQQTVFLALTLLESCVKNCGMDFVASFDRGLMDEVVQITKRNKGHKNADEALRLIQQWGRMYENDKMFPLFQETYMHMKSRGVVFPKEEPIPEMPPAPKRLIVFLNLFYTILNSFDFSFSSLTSPEVTVFQNLVPMRLLLVPRNSPKNSKLHHNRL
jgi:hypothetical protein